MTGQILPVSVTINSLIRMLVECLSSLSPLRAAFSLYFLPVVLALASQQIG